jgi:molybdate transport system permease protein
MAARGTVRRAGFAVVITACLAVALAFLLLPIAAIFLEAPLRELPDLLGQEVVRDAIVITIETNLVANVLILGFGTPAAYALASRRFRGRNVVLTLVELPLVLPPAVAGVGLLAAFGSAGLLGGELEARGVALPFTEAAVVLAIVFVASPFYLRQAITAFEGVDPDLIAAARTLGARPARGFFRIALPLALGGLLTGWALAFARGIGEFGATLIFAGNIQAVTQTLPLAIYEQLQVDFDVALAMGVLLVALSAAILLSTKLLTTWTTFTSRSPGSSGTSASTSS